MKYHMHQVERYCERNGVRLTERRKQVLRELLQSEKALSAYELIDDCNRNGGKNISAMSIYRVLEYLESQRLIHKLNLTNKYVACSHIVCEHGHDTSQFLICSGCSKVEEVNVSTSTISALEASVEAVGFSLVSPHLEVQCLCGPCSREESNKESMNKNEKLPNRRR